MKQRPLGTTGLSVSEIGFGSWQLGNTEAWEGTTGEAAIELVHQALDKGCNFFDTAPNYAGGKSEQLLGEALQDCREEVVISTKFGHFSDGSVNYNPDLLRKSVENSLHALQTDYVDSVLLHNPPQKYLQGSSKHFQILDQLQSEGLINAYGASVDTSEEIKQILQTTGAQVIEVMFNLLYQEPRFVFEEAKKQGVGLIIKVPLDSGWLTGKYDENSDFDDVRSRWTEEVVERRAKLVEEIKQIKPDKQDMVQEALGFILSYPEVSIVIPGIRTKKHLEENLAAEAIPQSRVAKYEQFYADNIQGNELPW